MLRYGRGLRSQGGFSQGGFGATTTLGVNAPFGSAVGGQFAGGQFVGGQFAGGQFVGGQVAGGQFAGGAVQTVTGAPIFVPQPFGVPVGVPQLRGVSAALPFAFAAGIGTSFAAGGDFFTEKPAGFATDGLGGVSTGRSVSALDSISYGDAYGNVTTYDIGAEFDVNRDTTLLGRVGYAQADGDSNRIGTVSEGSVVDADLFAEFSDLEQFTIEGGVRKYLGGSPTGIRPYVSGVGGFVYTDDIDVTQTSAAFAGGPEIQEYADGGWSPTAAGLVGAEWQVGQRAAIGIESGLRWTDNLDTNFESKDRWSIPLQLRGRVSF